jgi:hypothetical protein
MSASQKVRLPIARLAQIKAAISTRVNDQRSAVVQRIRSNRRGVYFRGLPRLGRTNPRAPAMDRSWLANLSA